MTKYISGAAIDGMIFFLLFFFSGMWMLTLFHSGFLLLLSHFVEDIVCGVGADGNDAVVKTFSITKNKEIRQWVRISEAALHTCTIIKNPGLQCAAVTYNEQTLRYFDINTTKPCGTVAKAGWQVWLGIYSASFSSSPLLFSPLLSSVSF